MSKVTCESDIVCKGLSFSFIFFCIRALRVWSHSKNETFTLDIESSSRWLWPIIFLIGYSLNAKTSPVGWARFMKQNVYEKITNLIVEKLESGVIPWMQPYKIDGCMPKNYGSGRQYTGINYFILQCYDFDDLRFLTFNQVKELGGKLKKGSKGIPVIFWKLLESKKDPNEKIPFLKYYNVFNIECVEGIDIKPINEIPFPTTELDPCELADAMLGSMHDLPTIKEQNGIPCYRPASDMICMPKLKQFVSTEEYYSTLFHEIIHSTGHASRLNRFEANDEMYNNTRKSYSYEELVAEMGSAFLCAESDIANDTLDNSAAYIKGWIRFLTDDPKVLIKAAAAAQKATNFLLNI